MRDQVALHEPGRRILPVPARTYRNPPPHRSRREHAPPAPDACLLTDIAKTPIDRRRAHRRNAGPHIFAQLRMPMPLHRLHERRQQDLQALAANPVRGLPQDNQGIPNLVAILESPRPPITRLRRSRTPKQTDRMLPVMPGHRHELVRHA